jgi:alpha-1,2-mannosyltransferase
VLGWIYTAILVWVTVRAAQRPQTEAEKPLVWLSIILLATLRSPFLPATYGVIPALWLLTLLAATYRPSAKTLALVVVAVAALNLHWPLDWAMDPRLRAILYTIPQAMTVGLAVLALRRSVPEAATTVVPSESAPAAGALPVLAVSPSV